MKIAVATIASALLLAGFASGAVTQASAHGWSKKRWNDDYRYRRHRAERHRFTQRELDTLPIRITQPPDTSHYVYDDYPVWAARAFQPNYNR
jgi:hypothetical protein